jgi:two-component system response regulator BaeR
MNHSLFIVEDEPELASLMADYARASGYAPEVFLDGREALAALRARPPALVVLDLMLPGMDGLTLCRELRSFSDLPVIMVTARVEEVDRLLGLDVGADDYLCKPFSPRELMARIKAILRRAGPAPEQPIRIDDAARRITVRGKLLDLTPSEYAILQAMLRRPGQIFPRAQLLDLARADAAETTDRAIDTHIKNLRRKLAHHLPGDQSIHSVYGLGYRFETHP